MGAAVVSETGYTELEVVRTFMRDVDVVSPIRKLDSAADYLELLELFYTDGERKSALLPQLLEHQEDLGRYVIEVHGLKSAAANIGADKLSAMAKEHEFAGKDGKTEWITANLEGLEAAYQGVLSEIKRVLTLQQYGRFAPRNDADLPAIGEEELRARLEEAVGFLEDFESKEAARCVEELLGTAVPEDVREGLEKAQSLLKVYDDEQAEELLRGLVQR